MNTLKNDFSFLFPLIKSLDHPWLFLKLGSATLHKKGCFGESPLQATSSSVASSFFSSIFFKESFSSSAFTEFLVFKIDFSECIFLALLEILLSGVPFPVLAEVPKPINDSSDGIPIIEEVDLRPAPRFDEISSTFLTSLSFDSFSASSVTKLNLTLLTILAAIFGSLLFSKAFEDPLDTSILAFFAGDGALIGVTNAILFC